MKKKHKEWSSANVVDCSKGDGLTVSLGNSFCKLYWFHCIQWWSDHIRSLIFRNRNTTTRMYCVPFSCHPSEWFLTGFCHLMIHQQISSKQPVMEKNMPWDVNRAIQHLRSVVDVVHLWPIIHVAQIEKLWKRQFHRISSQDEFLDCLHSRFLREARYGYCIPMVEARNKVVPPEPVK